MDLLKIGQQLLGDKLGDNASGMMSALSGLTKGEGLDLAGIKEKLQAGGMGDKVDTWMGDGANADMSADEVKNVFGEEGVNEVANQLGVDKDAAASKLGDVLPSLMDKASSNGDLMSQFTGGGAGGLLGMAKGLFNK